MGSTVQLSHLLSKNWVGRSPPYSAQGILGMTPKTLKIWWKSRNQFLRYLAFYCPSLRLDTIVSSTLIMESPYSDWYSFTSYLVPFRSYRSILFKFWTLCVIEPPFGGLETTYDVYFSLIGKHVVDFLVVLIELFLPGVTAEAENM